MPQEDEEINESENDEIEEDLPETSDSTTASNLCCSY